MPKIIGCLSEIQINRILYIFYLVMLLYLCIHLKLYTHTHTHIPILYYVLLATNTSQIGRGMW